ncbi:MAG: hypothetical protein WDN28_07575 [Chthoniobacter sp.]
MIDALIDRDPLGGRIEDALRHLPAKHLIKHHAEAVDVRAMIHARAALLLRRHVIRCTKHHARHRLAPLLGGRRIHAREAEVGHLHPALRVHQHVGRLDVAMHHAFHVRVLQRLANAHDQFQGLVRLEPGRLDQMVQRRPLDELHDEIEMPLRRGAEVEYRDDVRVVQFRHRPRFAHKTIGKIPVDADLERQQLDRHHAIQRGLHGLVTAPMPPRPNTSTT